MIEYKKLHDSFLLHQAFVAVAAAAAASMSNSINQSSSTTNSSTNNPLASSVNTTTQSSDNLQLKQFDINTSCSSNSSNSNSNNNNNNNNNNNSGNNLNSNSTCSPNCSQSSISPSSRSSPSINKSSLNTNCITNINSSNCNNSNNKRGDISSEFESYGNNSKRVRVDSSSNNNNNNHENYSDIDSEIEVKLVDNDNDDNVNSNINDDDDDNYDTLNEITNNKYECGDETCNDCDKCTENNKKLDSVLQREDDSVMVSESFTEASSIDRCSTDGLDSAIKSTDISINYKRKYEEDEIDVCEQVSNSSHTTTITTTKNSNNSKLNNLNSRKSSSFFISDILGLESNQVNKVVSSSFNSNSSTPLIHSPIVSSNHHQHHLNHPHHPLSQTPLISNNIHNINSNILLQNYNTERLIQQYQYQLQRSMPFLSHLQPIDFYRLISSSINYDTSNKEFSHNQTENTNSNNILNNSSRLASPLASQQSSSSNQNKAKDQDHHKSLLKSERDQGGASASILSSLEQLTKSQFNDCNSKNSKSNIKKSSSEIMGSISSKKPDISLNQSNAIISSNINNNNNNKQENLNLVKPESNFNSATNSNEEPANSKANNANLWPAWVYCTRYSDRPSAGPRHRKKTKKDASSCKSSLLKSVNLNKSLTNDKRDNVNQSYASSSSSNSSFSLSSPSQQHTSSPFLNAINSITKKTPPVPVPVPAPAPATTSTNHLINRASYETSSHDNMEKSSLYLNENDYDDKSDNEDLLNEDYDDNDDNDSNTSHSKRPRTAFTSSQLNRLKHEFEKCKYLTGEKRQYLANELNLNESQIKIWFQNKRAKIKKTSGVKNSLALQLMAQGLYNHSNNSKSSNADD